MDWLLFGTLVSINLFIYHHWIYPKLLQYYVKHKQPDDKVDTFESRHYASKDVDSALPNITIVMPIYNESKHLGAKLSNLLMLDYPADKLNIVLGFDGCTDDSVAIATAYLPQYETHGITIELDVVDKNHGKVHVTNKLLTQHQSTSDILVLSDVSALISIDAMHIFAHRMAEEGVGVVTGDYQLYEHGSKGEAHYWDYQRNIRKAESMTGSIIGPPGALYAIKASLFEQIPVDTINDDFVFPMLLVSRGYRAVMDERISIIEMEATNTTNDFTRRTRIGAGNVQQAFRLRGLFSLKSGLTSFNFFSGKFLRTLMPFNLLVLFVLTFFLTNSQSIFVANAAWFLWLGQCGLYAGSALALLFDATPVKQPWASLYYIATGYMASFYGGLRYLFGLDRGSWIKISSEQQATSDYQKKSVVIPKRFSDILISITALIVFLPLVPLAALAIKLNSKGPVFYRQLRVGEIKNEYVEVFMLIKFRTMGVESETKSGPVWAQKQDARVTSVGRFLRKTRIDELPQLINVLLGDMAIVGPRPERPVFCGKLEEKIPYYLERTNGVRPGITGLAQVSQGADTCLEDVQNKLYWDHSYALSLTSFSRWLKADAVIILKTFLTMVTFKGN
ncbi:glycosyltransferase [Moritella marina ATCC 15381]|uniref:Glycosyltransferase n=1 Tax=Moritella marina ATCC 15381 TaxID=1202962 RepID=A0A5J6WKX8_MORMI|nr:sugar transferase [Moritella marina]QFI37445.1 glycosyltransferase [Moritella marina ATCC 15381]